MSPRCRQHVNPLGLGFESLRSRPPRLSPGLPVEVEVGCADAEFLFARAARRPDCTYVGVEIREALVDHVNERAALERLPVQAIFCHANHHLGALFPPGSVERVYLNFPDPWFKRRHQKRRMVDAQLARQVARILESGGEVFFQSDVWDVALEAMEVLERAGESARGLFENLAGAWSFWKAGNPFGARSARERVCEEEGKKIWRLRYRVRS